MDEAPELEATVLLTLNQAAAAEKVLADASTLPAADRPGYQLAQGEVDAALGLTPEAVRDFKRVLLGHPLSPEAHIARSKLTAFGAESSLTATELRSLGDAYYRAGRYGEASEEYHALARLAGLDASARNGFAVAAAACDLKLKVLSVTEVQALPDTQDENGARRLEILMELARNRDDLDDAAPNRGGDDQPVPAKPVSGGSPLFERKYVPAAEGVLGGGGVLQLSGDAFSG